MKYRYITIWFNRNKNQYYYKKVKGTYMQYTVGYVNQYDHELLLVIDVTDLPRRKELLRNRLINCFINLLYKLKK